MRGQAFSLLPFIATGFAASSIAFVVSNAFWYAFSGRFNDMTVMEFSARIAHYGLPYVGYAMMYLGIAWVALAAIGSLSRQERIGNA